MFKEQIRFAPFGRIAPARSWRTAARRRAGRRDTPTRLKGPTCRAAFTLIELLIVVAIIALLVSILLPSLAQARTLTRRVMCASNTRQIAVGLHHYAAEDAHGYFPASPNNQNSSLNYWLSTTAATSLDWLKQNGGPDFAASEWPRCIWGWDWKTGWLSWGLLYRDKIIDNPEVFCCPALGEQSMLSWPNAWRQLDRHIATNPAEAVYRYSGYYYRIFGQPREISTPPIMYSDVDRLLRMEANADEPLVADLFIDIRQERGDAPHLDPFGVNAAFADGHAAWVELGEKERSRCAATAGLTIGALDIFTYLYFRALGTGKFNELDAAGFTAP